VALAAVAGSGTWLGGCSDSPAAPGIQPEIINQPGNFEYQVSDVQGYTGTLSYNWQNSGVQANVDQSTTVSGGSVTLRILDATGAQVYSRSLAENGSFDHRRTGGHLDGTGDLLRSCCPGGEL
jgi:hypothetical protein